MKKGVLRNFGKFTGKHLCQSLFFNKVADLRPATLLKKRLWHTCFPANFAKFLRTQFLQNTSGRLLLYYPNKSLLAYNFIKKDSGTCVFLWIFQNVSERLFYRTPLVIAKAPLGSCKTGAIELSAAKLV